MKIMHLKANYCYPSKHWKVFTKTLSLMKFMAIFIFIAGLHVSAKANTQVTLSEHNVQLQKVFQQIQDMIFDTMLNYCNKQVQSALMLKM